MFDFIRKSEIWHALDADRDRELNSKLSFQLKTMQDMAVYEHIRSASGKEIAEIGGGDSRILPQLTAQNRCFNIEPFEGANAGPESEIIISGVTNIRTVVGAFDSRLKSQSFDIVFSISVVEHVTDEQFAQFWEDCVRILKPGGVMYHAIDMYLAEEPTPFWQNRYQMYRNAIAARDDLEPVGLVFPGPLKFSPDMASNPDNIMHSWKTISPALNDLRQIAQSVSLVIGARRIDQG